MKTYIVSSIIFVIIDAIFLSFMSKRFNKMIKNVQGSAISLNLPNAIICYLFLIFTINYFVIKDQRTLTDAFLLGLGIYGVYEFTNAAIIKNWNLTNAVIDTVWGGVLFATTTFLTYKLKERYPYQFGH
jgi:uncharacterized membrane protein